MPVIKEIPFIPNCQGETPLHLAINKNNTRVVDKMLRVLSGVDFDHHSKYILKLYAGLIDLVPEAFCYYVEKRMIITPWLSDITRAKI